MCANAATMCFTFQQNGVPIDRLALHVVQRGHVNQPNELWCKLGCCIWLCTLPILVLEPHVLTVAMPSNPYARPAATNVVPALNVLPANVLVRMVRACLVASTFTWGDCSSSKGAHPPGMRMLRFHECRNFFQDGPTVTARTTTAARSTPSPTPETVVVAARAALPQVMQPQLAQPVFVASLVRQVGWAQVPSKWPSVQPATSLQA